MPILLGLTGPAGCGKDSIASRLLACHGFVPTAFADPLRSAASEAFGVDYHVFIDRELKDKVDDYWGMTPRQMLQRMGTEGFRNVFGEDFWIKRWVLSHTSICHVNHVVVTDVRFENEAAAIRDLGGQIVHVSRPGLANLEGNHASGRGIAFQDGDLRLDNDRDLKGLYEKVDILAGDL